MTTLVALGDLMLGDSATTVGFGTRSRYPGLELRVVFAQISQLVSGAGLVIGNLESPLAEAGLGRTRLSRDQMRGDREYARVLREVGFNAIGVANNHAMQHGRSAFEDTVSALSVGIRGSGEWSSQPVVIPVDGIGNVGILGYCWRPRQYSRGEPAYAEGDPASALADIGRLRPKVKKLVVSLHWGDEFLEEPSELDRQFAVDAVAAGVDVLIGHHPHVVRPVERFAGAVVAYSLGNAVSDMLWMEQLRVGAALQVDLNTGNAAVARLRVDESYVTRVESGWTEIGDTRVRGLPELTYRQEVAKSLRAQRIAAYGYAARNARQYPLRVASELLATTLYNKISALWERH